MTGWIVFAPWLAHDEALRNAHWVAMQTAALVPAPMCVVDGPGADRAALASALLTVPAPVGLALFGHGDAAAVYGADDEPALDASNLCGEWVHAFACRTGDGLALEAAPRGVRCYLGYGVALLVGWTIEELHPDLCDRLAGLVTAATAALLDGTRSRRTLQRAVSARADALVDWINTHAPDEHLGLGVFADMLVDRVVLTGVDATP